MSILLTLLLWLLGPQVEAQQPYTESIAGTVTRADTRAPLPQTRIELTREDYARVPTGHERVCKPEPDTEVTEKRRFVVTDANGRFTIADVPAGRYYLSAQHEGFLRFEYGQRGNYPIGTVIRIDPEGDTIVSAPAADVPGESAAENTILPLLSSSTVAAPRGGLGRDQQGTSAGAPSAIRGGTIAQTGQRGGLGRDAERVPAGAGANSAIGRTSGTPRIQLRDLMLSLTPAPAIAGRVLDERGMPQAAAAVQAYQFRYTPINGRVLKSIRATLTSDDGGYRLFWLNPGRYIVAAAHTSYGLQPWMSGLTFTPNLPNLDAGQPTVFFSEVTTAANAQPVPLNPGEQPIADFHLQDRPRFTVRIRLDGDIPPSPALVFVPYGGDFCTGLDYGISAKSDGTFEIRDVPQGLYVAMAISGRDAVSPLITVKVDQQPPAPIPLPVVTPIEVRGVVDFDAIPPWVELGRIRVSLVRTGQEVSQTATGIVDPSTGRFSIPGVGPGAYYPVVELPPGAYVQTITAIDCDTGKPSPNYRYQDLHGHFDSQRPLSIPEVIPNAAKCLDVQASYGRPLRGYVRDRAENPEAGALVVAIPRSVWAVQEDRGATPPDRYLTAVTDDRGYFELRGAAEATAYVADLPGGDVPEYHLYAFENIDANAIYDPGFSDRFRGRETFSVRTWAFEDGQWNVKTISSGTIATWQTCGAFDAPNLKARCYLISIPAVETAEIR